MLPQQSGFDRQDDLRIIVDRPENANGARGGVVYSNGEEQGMDPDPRVVFMGTPEFAVPPLAALLRAGYDVAGVLTRRDSASGRGQRIEESPVKQFARAENLLIQQPGTCENRTLWPR
jgi:hypothetical protein